MKNYGYKQVKVDMYIGVDISIVICVSYNPILTPYICIPLWGVKVLTDTVMV